jgi:dihydroxy-acid dehydratase
MADLKPRSHDVTTGMQKAPARAMLRAVGMTDDDWDKPQIGVASSWNEITPCNLSLQRLALRAKDGVFKAGGSAPVRHYPVSDGISMATRACKPRSSPAR